MTGIRKMKFTDLNFDCLENVLEYLKLIDLLNVADTSKRLNKAAELVYAQKYGKKKVRFGDMTDARVSEGDHGIEITGKHININDFKTDLQLMRCVGSVISSIEFLFLKNAERNLGIREKIEFGLFSYINIYCAEYLKEFHIGALKVKSDDNLSYVSLVNRENLLDHFDNSFSSVECFEIPATVFTERTRRINTYSRINSKNYTCLQFM